MKCSLVTLVFLSLMTASAFASDQIIKTCKTSLRSLDNEDLVIQATIKIIKRGDSYVARLTQNVQGHSQEFEQKTLISEDSVRAGLTGDEDADTLNTSEKLIVHAMSLEAIDPEKKVFDAGLDLSAVRSAKVYNFSKEGEMGMISVVEAKDEKGLVLGSFFGGFMVSPCK